MIDNIIKMIILHNRIEYVEQFSYGVPDANGTWNGMIRKLIDKV